MLHSILIKDKEFRVAISDTEESRKKGLSGQSKLGKNKGMLFVFEKPSLVKMVMTDMNFDLDFIFLDENWKIKQLGSLNKNNENGIITNSSISMILEVNKGIINELKLKIGDTLKPEKSLEIHSKGVQQFKTGGKFEMVGDKIYKIIEDDIKADPTKMQLLNEKGEVVANVDSGARIFSREHTKKIVELSKKAKTEELGKLIIAVFDKQDTQKQEYVKDAE